MSETGFEQTPEMENTEAVSEQTPETESAETVSEQSSAAENAEAISEQTPETESAEAVSEQTSEAESAETVSEHTPETESTAAVSEQTPETESAQASAEQTADTEEAEMSFEQMLENEDSIKTIHPRDIIEGTVISVTQDEIVLNIGYKTEGILTKNEYSNKPDIDLRELVHPDDKMKVRVLKVDDADGQVRLTYKRLAAEEANKKLEEAYNNGQVLKGRVVGISSGLNVAVGEARVFIPASLVSDVYERDLTKYQDQEVEFKIIEFTPKKRRVIGDRKQLIIAEKEERKKALFERIEVGMTVDGVVKNVTDFGAFIDIGGVDGLLHISEMSWGRVGNPRKLFKAGDEVTTFIKDINNEKVALSLKFPDSDPWLNASEKYAIGKIVKGRVARMTDFGAFVELETGVDALLHVSQIAREHIDKPSDVLKVGQEIEAKIVDFNEDRKKISLSMKVLIPDNPAPFKAEKEAPSVSIGQTGGAVTTIGDLVGGANKEAKQNADSKEESKAPADDAAAGTASDSDAGKSLEAADDAADTPESASTADDAAKSPDAADDSKEPAASDEDE